VIAAIAILATLFVTYYAFAQQVPFISNPFTLHALVNNSVAVRADSPVRIAGIDVGKVETVTPAGRASQVNFTMEDNGLPVHSDATIRIRDRLFLEGGYYLELDPGSPSAPLLKDGATIPESQTATPVQFYKVLSTFDAAARASLENLLNTLNDSLSAVDSQGRPIAQPGAVGLRKTIPQLTPTLKDVALVSRALRGTRPGDVETLLSSAANVTTTLQHSSPQLADLVTSLNAASGALAAADGSLAQSISGLEQTLQVSPAALSAIDASLPPVNNLAIALDPSLKLAPPLLDGLTQAVTELGAIVSPAQRGKLLTSLRATFQQFPTLLTQLGSVFPITKTVTDCLTTHVTPVLNSVINDGALSTGRPVWQDFVHFVVGLAGSAQNFDANGHWGRFLVGVGTNSLSSLGTLPLVGQLLGSAPAGSSSLGGSRPVWVGDLGPSAYQPGASCASQPVPNLASAGAAPDLRPTGTTAAPKATTRGALEAALAKATRAVSGR
jgi:virulence factor Mce-like protein